MDHAEGGISLTPWWWWWWYWPTEGTCNFTWILIMVKERCSTQTWHTKFRLC